MRALLVSVALLLAACGQSTPPEPTADYTTQDLGEPRQLTEEEYNEQASQPGLRSCPELWAAASANDVQSLQNILTSGVSVNCHNETMSGETALMAAASGASIEATQFLLDRGADVNARDDGGNTALSRTLNTRQQLAAQNALPEVVARLDTIAATLRSRGAT